MNKTNSEIFINNYMCGSLSVLAEGERIWLARPRKEELDLYMQVLMENSDSKRGFDDSAYRAHIWQELNREDALFVSVIRKSDGAFCGYCGMEDLKAEIWELAIEFLEEYHGQGLGYEALRLLLLTLKEKTGMPVFISRVEGHNLASQKLMEKVGGVMSGMSLELDPCTRRRIQIIEYRINPK